MENPKYAAYSALWGIVATHRFGDTPYAAIISDAKDCSSFRWQNHIAFL